MGRLKSCKPLGIVEKMPRVFDTEYQQQTLNYVHDEYASSMIPSVLLRTPGHVRKKRVKLA